MALMLSLRVGERLVVNGALVEIGGKQRAVLLLQNKVSVLLAKDIMRREHAVTPARRIYFIVMSMYLEEENKEVLLQEFATSIAEFMKTIRDPAALSHCVEISKDVSAAEYYRALTRSRQLMALEDAGDVRSVLRATAGANP